MYSRRVSSVTYLNAHICTLFLTMHLKTVYFSNLICLQSAQGSCKSTGVALRPEAQIWCCIYLDFPKLFHQSSPVSLLSFALSSRTPLVASAFSCFRLLCFNSRNTFKSTKRALGVGWEGKKAKLPCGKTTKEPFLLGLFLTVLLLGSSSDSNL